MHLDSSRIRTLLKSFDFRSLFIEELGWDHHDARLETFLDNRSIEVEALAQKRGMVAYLCPTPGEKLPDHAMRRKIEQQVSKTAHEHLIIFIDADKTTQVWQWVRREPGKPLACREHTFHRTQPGDTLIQKLQAIAFSLEEEEILTLSDVTRRAKTGFDVERVTRRFYDQFKKEHATFLKFVTGITDQTDQEWYASVMLNRLMFVYFIQRKGFLDGDPEYLRNRLILMQREHGQDKFYSFYRYFLLRLFHEGLGGKIRTPELENLLGKIPYFDGGFFERHPVEQRYTDMQIPDEAFERVFDYFDRYQWHLDERPLRADNEINPDVLGYIFEKYINQKQMGAYYTKEDITEYISKNTVLPFLFDAARSKCKVAFENPGGPTVWSFLSTNPDRYLYQAVKHGVIKDDGSVLPETDLPDFVQKGMHDPKARMFNHRYNLQQAPAGDPIRLVTETWREYICRRNRCLQIREKLQNGEVREINDLITYNLDIRQFAQDVIENCDLPAAQEGDTAQTGGPDLLRAFWHTINGHIPEKSHEKYRNGITILDPTCGSGAFLFAALNILEPLYEACLDRMAAFVEDLDRSNEKHRLEKYSDFRKVLKQVEAHPNRRYFIFKNIILDNLFGVDIMEEAVEICKLRLFLKLVAQVEPDANKENFGIEPLPDIDFNIRAGNTLVGYATADEVRKVFTEDAKGQKKLQFGETLSEFQRFEEQVELADRAFKQFRRMQIDPDMDSKDFAHAKQTLRERLKALNDELNRHLAREYGVKVENKADYEKWLKSHQPFHWFVEFYGIMQDGGFDVIIGNPPYLELRQVNYTPKNYRCLNSAAIHSMCIERSVDLLGSKGSMSMIVPLALPSTQRMQIIQQLLEENHNTWYANYAWRPGKLFDTVNRALTIFVISPAAEGHTFSTNYQKWTSENREGLFDRLSYVNVQRNRQSFWVPKLGEIVEQGILEKCQTVKTTVFRLIGSSEGPIYYRTTGGLYWKVFTDFAPSFRLNGKPGHSSRETYFSIAKRRHIKPLIAVLSSDLFWWWYTITSNLRDLNPYDIQNFPIPESAIIDEKIYELGAQYLKDINKYSTILVREQKQTGKTETQSFKIQKSKPIIDQIDQALAKYYDFTEEELDFIINYDIKYRMGRIELGEEEN